MTDTIQVRKLKLHSVIGVYAWERRQPRTLLLDIELDTDTRKAAQTDDLRHALDYHRACDIAQTLARDSQFQLLEALAEALAAKLLAEFPATAVRLWLHKPGAVAAAESVGVRIERLAVKQK